MLAKVWQVPVRKCLYVSRCAPPSEVKRPAGTPQASRIKSVVLSLRSMLLAGITGPNRLLLEVPVRRCRLPLAPALFHGLKGSDPTLPIGHGVAQGVGLDCCGTVRAGHQRPSGYAGIVLNALSMRANCEAVSPSTKPREISPSQGLAKALGL